MTVEPMGALRLDLERGRHCPLGLHSAFRVVEGAAIVEFGVDSGLVYLREGDEYLFPEGRAPQWIVADHISIETAALTRRPARG